MTTWPADRPSYVTALGTPSPKWRGVSMTRIREHQGQIQNAQAGIRALQVFIREQNERLEVRVGELLDLSPEQKPVQLGIHSCENSPTLLCVYPAEDPSKDECLFCGDPHERK